MKTNMLAIQIPKSPPRFETACAVELVDASPRCVADAVEFVDVTGLVTVVVLVIVVDATTTVVAGS